MRSTTIAAVLGVALTVGGVGALGYGITAMSASPGDGCSGDECINDPGIIGFPLGIVAIVFGMIIASWAIGSIRQQRGSNGPLSAFGFMSGLGGVFVAMGAIFLATSQGNPNDDGTGVFLGALFGIMGLCFVGIDFFRFRAAVKKDRLRATGLHGTAKVIDVRDTNVTVNNSPMVNLDLEVTVPGQPPFRTHKRTIISRLSVGALTPGATIPVLADPAKPQDIVLDWEAGTTVPDAGGIGGGLGGRNAWLAGFAGGGSPIAFPTGASTAVNAQVLRSVSEALERAAERAEQGGGGATVMHASDGSVVVNGGASVIVNGRQVPPGDVAATLAGLPAALSGAFGAASRTAGGSLPATGFSTSGATALDGSSVGALTPMPPSTPIPSLASLGGDAAPGSSGDVPPPGVAVGADALPARASLDTITDTGVDMNGGRLYTFDLTVSVAGRQPYQVKHAAVVPHNLVARLAKGASFPARVDPAQPGQIAIAFDR